MKNLLPFNLIGKSTIAFLIGQSCRVLKSWYTGGCPKQGFRCCFADKLNQSLISSVWGVGWKMVYEPTSSLDIWISVIMQAYWIGPMFHISWPSLIKKEQPTKLGYCKLTKNSMLWWHLLETCFLPFEELWRSRRVEAEDRDRGHRHVIKRTLIGKSKR